MTGEGGDGEDDDRTAATAYDEMADTYREETETSAYNADLEFPGTTDLLPDVEGEQVLDAGCGAGRYTEWLLDRGAEVVGVDASGEMLDRARARADDRATFHRADLGEPFAFADDAAFDGAVCALALDYVEDWGPTFAEFARVLRPGGFVGSRSSTRSTSSSSVPTRATSTSSGGPRSGTSTCRTTAGRCRRCSTRCSTRGSDSTR